MTIKLIIKFVSEVGTSSTVEAATIEPPVSDHEDPQLTSDDECAPPSPKHSAVNYVSSLTDVVQVIGSHNLSASTRYSY